MIFQLEASLDENDGATIEEKLRRAEEMKEKVRNEGKGVSYLFCMF